MTAGNTSAFAGYPLKDIRGKMPFFKLLLRTDNELLVSQIKKRGVTDFVSEIKLVENQMILKNWRA